MEHRRPQEPTELPRTESSSSKAAGQAGRKSEPIHQARNGSMVQDEQDMRRLGNDMKNMKTNSQIQEEGLVPDPIQE